MAAKDSHQQDKQKLFAQWMEDDHVLLHLDSRRGEVSVPEHLKDDPALTLKLSYLFQGETTHDEKAIRSFLKFSGQYFECVVPWVAIWGMTASSGENRLWAEDLPPELVWKIAKDKLSGLKQRIFGKKDAESEETSNEEKPAPREKQKGHLKRVK